MAETPPWLPWYAEAWSRLQAQRAAGRLPHALLIHGPAGVGKGGLARLLAHGLLCEAPGDQGRPCGACRACTLLAAGSHPDFLELVPEEPGKPIRIDAVRELGAALALASQYGGARVAVIDPADAMNTAACNSLLKTLEEPPPGTHLLLVSARPARLPATVRSRCQRLAVAPPAPEDARAWLVERLDDPAAAPALLAAAGGAPLAALALAENAGAVDAAFEALLELARGRRDPLALATDWAQEAGAMLGWIYGWSADLVRLATAGADAPLRDPSRAEALQALAQRLDLEALHRWLDRLLEALGLADSTLNRQLLMEDLLLEWVKVTAPARR